MFMTCTLASLPLISNFLAQMLETQEHHCLRGTTSLPLSASSTGSPPHLSFLGFLLQPCLSLQCICMNMGSWVPSSGHYSI